MATVDGAWQAGIGDPTLGGWITVVAYFATAWAAWRAARAFPGDKLIAQRQFWQALMTLMLILGVNKQLDLQTAFTEAGRLMALQQGWYEHRRIVQVVFILVLGVGVSAALVWLFRRLRPLSRAQKISLAGLGFLGTFVVVRAASFHHVDALIHTDVLGLRWNWVFELSGIGGVFAGAWIARRGGRSTMRG